MWWRSQDCAFCSELSWVGAALRCSLCLACARRAVRDSNDQLPHRRVHLQDTFHLPTGRYDGPGLDLAERSRGLARCPPSSETTGWGYDRQPHTSIWCRDEKRAHHWGLPRPIGHDGRAPRIENDSGAAITSDFSGSRWVHRARVALRSAASRPCGRVQNLLAMSRASSARLPVFMRG